MQAAAGATAAAAAPPPPQPLPGRLAPRSAAALQPSLSYWGGYMKAAVDLWSPDNPGGFISVVVAENRLSTAEMAEALRERSAQPWPPRLLHYQDPRGLLELRQVLASMMADTFMRGLPGPIDPKHITVLDGVGSILDLLTHCIASPGECLLVPAPFYPAFVNDLKVRNSVCAAPAALDLSLADLGPGLTAAAEQAVASGCGRVAGVLLTNPNNPDGRVLSSSQVASVIRWCLARQVHCISDEIYALSVYGADGVFESAAVVAARDVVAASDDPDATAALAADLVHVCWGASKDLCGSGLRLGVLLSANAALNQALDNVAYLAAVPGPLQLAAARLLGDRAWLAGFLAENRRRLAACYAQLSAALDAAGIPYTPSVAGMFTWLDLRGAFAAPTSTSSGDGPGAAAAAAAPAPATWEDEAALWACLVDEHRVVLTPGRACHAAEPGFFRMCWAWPGDPACIPVAVERIAAAVQQFRTQRAAGC